MYLADEMENSVDEIPIRDHIDIRKESNMGLPVFTEDITDAEMDKMADNAMLAANFLKAISHEGRLMILCHLASGEKSVTELESLLSARQASVSQQLSRLRLEGLVTPRREGKAIYYSLTDDRPKQIMEIVYDLFCKDN
jgi:DNA-binding transcriptional ArsR family regulator